jgi:hypothetical protein
VDLIDVPSIDEPPAVWEESSIAARARAAALNRRSVLRLAAASAMGVGIWALEQLPNARRAFANNPNPILSQWADCSPSDFYSSSTICVPTSAYYNSVVCAGTWHRNDKYSSQTVTYDYTFNNTSCSGRNAWRWTLETVHRKCSDGHTYYLDGSTYRNTFSICRTAI